MNNPLVLNPLNTLMLRDLVYNHRKWVCPVTGIDKKHISVIAQHYGETSYERETISPIPLTEEIIKQLGWQQVVEGDEGFDSERKSTLSKQYKNPDYTKTLNITHRDESGIWYILGGEFHMRYVHDLQHVLRHTVTDDIGYNNEKGFYLIDGYIERLYENDEENG